jgi:multidrug efflux system membrane fusion protein
MKAFAGAAVVVAGLVACGSHPAETPNPRSGPPVPVRAATAVREDVPVRISAIGTVEAVSTVEIRSQVEGQLAQVGFAEGQQVHEGELLFVIDPRPFEAKLHEAEANLERDRAQAANASANAKRVATLYHDGVMSQDEFDRVRTDATARAAAVAADEATVERARLDVQYCHLSAPIDGRIGQLLVHQGSIVKANDTVLAVINRIRPIRVAFSVPQQELPEIRRHMAEGPLAVEAFLGDQAIATASGRLEFVNNAVDTTTGTVLLKALFDNTDEALWPGQFVRTTLTLTTLGGVVTVPAAAVQAGQSGPYVFVIGADDTVESRPVRLGIVSNGRQVITDGLAAGDRVVTDGQIRLAPGLRVVVKDGPAPMAEAQR